MQIRQQQHHVFVKLSSIRVKHELNLGSLRCLHSALAWVSNANIVEFEQLGYGSSGFKPQFEISPIQARTGVSFETYRNSQNNYMNTPMFAQAFRGNQVLRSDHNHHGHSATATYRRFSASFQFSNISSTNSCFNLCDRMTSTLPTPRQSLL
ncbi:Protein CBG22710 [Caenorhabditis briggsae]|uniref:Protein CBG22710 n=1 Tax=Caenorhabditis briggsae TaxID=6238 RepID=A8Y301_CAEBR|nr:Protein CBG22710 [Caenorhabditis briggsae]CAP39240.2 Protein CBG22710 [Caenorhabditis briggsae]